MSEGKASKKRRTAVWVIVVLATILGLAASLTVWVKRQALDTAAVTNLSTRIIQDDAVRSKLSVYLVDQVYNNTNVPQALSQRLPKNLQPLAAPLAGALRQLSVQAADTLLERPRVQAAFATAVKQAHAAFLRIVDDKATNVSTEGGVVYLNLRPLVLELADQLGIGDRARARLPATVGRVRLLKENQLDAIQTGASVINSLSVYLAIAVFGLYAIAVFLAKGFRRATLRNIGVALVLVGLLLLVVRRVAGNMIIHTVATGGGDHQAGHDIWWISTSLLSDIAYASIGYGLVVTVGAILAGPMRWATWVRRQLAPAFRDHVVLVYTVVAVLYLLVVLWAPTRAQTEWIPAIILAALLVVGVEALRRQTIAEFPPSGGAPERPAPA